MCARTIIRRRFARRSIGSTRSFLRERQQWRLSGGLRHLTASPMKRPSVRYSARSTNSRGGSRSSATLSAKTSARPTGGLFTTLVRFDAVYYSHFKCNLRRIIDYPNLSNYLRDLYQQPGVAATVNLDQIKRHYYGSQRHVNPTGIVPLGPQLDFSAPHDRRRFEN